MNNEEKILSMLETLVNKVSDLEQELQFVKHTVVRIENDHGVELRLLHDGYSANYEFYGRLEPRISKLEQNLDRLDTEVKVLRHAK